MTIPADFDGFMNQVLGQKMQDAMSPTHVAGDFSIVEHQKV